MPDIEVLLFSWMFSSFKTTELSLLLIYLTPSPLEFPLSMFSLLKSADLLNILKILDKPRVLKGSRANILAQMAAIVLLLKRAFSFIVRVTNQIRKLLHTNDPAIKERLKPPFIAKSIRNIIQLE